jgi:hypothetical protein
MIHIENILCEDYFRVECFDKEGNLKWAETITNLVVNVGLNDALDKYFKGSTYTASHFVGLTAATPVVAAADTMASHSGWTESVVYSNATRPAYTPGTVSGGSVDNSASKASFTIDTGGTIGGAFLTTDGTKSGATGILYGGGAFAGGNRAVISGDTVNVTVTATMAAA